MLCVDCPPDTYSEPGAFECEDVLCGDTCMELFILGPLGGMVMSLLTILYSKSCLKKIEQKVKEEQKNEKYAQLDASEEVSGDPEDPSALRAETEAAKREAETARAEVEAAKREAAAAKTQAADAAKLREQEKTSAEGKLRRLQQAEARRRREEEDRRKLAAKAPTDSDSDSDSTSDSNSEGSNSGGQRLEGGRGRRGRGRGRGRGGRGRGRGVAVSSGLQKFSDEPEEEGRQKQATSAEAESTKTRRASTPRLRAFAEAMQRKAEGNTAFKAKDYAVAEQKYEQALKAARRSAVDDETGELIVGDETAELIVVLNSNRSEALLQLARFAKAAEAAQAALQRDPSHSKSKDRLARAEGALQRELDGATHGSEHDDTELPQGTVVYVGRHRGTTRVMDRGTYQSFEGKWVGANEHTILFDNGSTEALKLKEVSDWRFVRT